MIILLAGKWFAWPPHIVHQVVAGLEWTIASLIAVLEWLSREIL